MGAAPPMLQTRTSAARNVPQKTWSHWIPQIQLRWGAERRGSHSATCESTLPRGSAKSEGCWEGGDCTRALSSTGAPCFPFPPAAWRRGEGRHAGLRSLRATAASVEANVCPEDLRMCKFPTAFIFADDAHASVRCCRSGLVTGSSLEAWVASAEHRPRRTHRASSRRPSGKHRRVQLRRAPLRRRSRGRSWRP